MSNSSSHLYAVILAGGSGTRLWPRSRRHHPKQLLDLVSTRTMLQETFDRIQPLLPSDQVYVITNADYVADVRTQLPEVPPENVFGEPDGRGTAPPIGFAACLLRERDPEAIMVSLAADHSIPREDEFRNAVRAGGQLATQNFLVTLGVVPTYPETGYGYIEAGEDLGDVLGLRARRVVRFTEKPDAETAASFVASDNYFWNSSIFIWRVNVILEEFAQYLPQHLTALNEIVVSHNNRATFDRVWSALPSETIDVGIMEKSRRVAVLPLDVGWSDVGSWATLHDLLASDGDKNVIVGDHIGVGTQSSLIYSQGRLIATVGLEDMIVVDTGDAILICPKSRAQDVKQIVDELKRRQQEKYL
jgi:mannose-1-phosphate guanylyltransferase